MKLAMIETKQGRARACIQHKDKLLDLRAMYLACTGESNDTLRTPLAIASCRDSLKLIDKLLRDSMSDDAPFRLEMNAVKFLPPVPEMQSIRDCMAYERHLIQCMRTVANWKLGPLALLTRGLLRPPKFWYEAPVYYKGNARSAVGHDQPVSWPSYTEKFDFELEFGIFIKKKGRNINKEKAHDYIAGYTIFNDFSARDVQLAEMEAKLGPAKGKDFDTGNSLGPWLVTPDEIPDPYALDVEVRVNGQSWSRGNTGGIQYTFEEMIEYISKDETLYPGDFIGSGTIPDCCGLELDRWLRDGDVVELEVAGIGCLRNKVKRAS
ncbi:MAG: 2-keto-4-pentenoate hydratase/2-oxohepta-3-ene-1,7-dioic acid hydratase in catechol pathway [Pirellulaceae bacterium]|jgi:2-keto-4-pentenoate hydratase/2-oxohepta-3-ene-1,7-dioic acid hydratase in catechol pathway